MALRLGVVGLGARGREWARQIQRSPGWQLGACVDSDPAALAGAAQELSLAAGDCFDSVDRALADAALDAVVVATPIDRHDEPCRAALESGVGVLVEKPFSMSARTAAALVEEAEERGVPLLVGQNYRFLRGQRAAQRVVRSGRLGAVRMVMCQYYRVRDEPGLRGIEHGVLWETGVHHIDALRALLGQEVVGVSAHAGPGSLRALLDFSGGVQATYTATFRSSGHEFFERGQEFYERIVGERGTLHVFHRWLVLCEAGRLPRLLRRGSRGDSEEQRLLRELERALRGERSSAVSGRENLLTLSAVEACATSIAHGRRVDPRELMVRDG